MRTTEEIIEQMISIMPYRLPKDLKIYIQDVIETVSKQVHEEGYLKGWNESLQWAAEHAEVDFQEYETNVSKQSILNGLKEEE